MDKNKIIEIIFCQNIIEGFWEINYNTNIVKEYYPNKFKKLKEKNVDDITAITILIIGYLSKECSEYSESLTLIVKKAKIFLKNKLGLSFNKIINEYGLVF